MIDKQRFSALVKKYLEGKATPAEREFLENLYDAMGTGKPIDSLYDETEANQLKEQMFSHIHRQVEERRPARIAYIRYASVAAALLAVVLVVFLLQNKHEPSGKNDATPAMASIQADTLRQLTLGDGTLVWLNAQSKLRYATDYGKKIREIYLEGEAYFEVKTDKEHPFLVHTQGLTTKVLGTKFNVKAYDPKAIEVTLVEGKVMLTAARSDKAARNDMDMDTLFLAPNEKALYVGDKLQTNDLARHGTQKQLSPAMDTTMLATTAALSKRMVPNALQSTMWRMGYLRFDNEKLQNVLETIGRKLHVTIKASPEFLDSPITLKVTDESLDGILFDIARQLHRSKTVGNQSMQGTAQYRRQGAEYYIE